MPTIQEILNEIDLTYRNTYTVAQKVGWMDTQQRQIFQKVPKESPPYIFTTIADSAFYALPDDCDRFGIKQVTIETKAGSERYDTLTYVSLESNQEVGTGSRLYSVLQNNLFLNPMPTAEDEGKKVYILYNHRPAALTIADLSATPELEEDFHELLLLGVLERIARARGEIEDKNNFATDFNILFADYEKMYKLRQPEYYKVNDNLPMRRGSRNNSRWARNSRIADLIPPGV
jgi:hypothetical protein